MKIFSLIPFPILMLIGIFVIIGIVYWQSKRKAIPGESEPSFDMKGLLTRKKGSDTVVPCRILDNITGRIYNSDLPMDTVKNIIRDYKTIGRRYDRDGKKLYGVNKYEENGLIKHRPLIMPKQTQYSPTEAHGDTQQGGIILAMEEVLKDDQKPFLQQYGQMLWWIAVIGFLIFLTISSQAN